MNKKRVPLYERLPEIYRIRDEEQQPSGQLREYLGLVEEVFGAVHANVEALYHDLFIETCDDWVIPYIGDLLGTSHLAGDAWARRADVADTVALRRRKGTLASIERLTFNLTRWGVRCVELRDRLVWNQHVNHQRPDAGGQPPYGLDTVTRFTPIRGGTVPLRDPALLSLLDTPFDPFAHVADVRPAAFGTVRHNLPNMAIFLWRLRDFRVKASLPGRRSAHATGAAGVGLAANAVRVEVHPLARPVRLFNTYRFDPGREPPVITELDETPGPMHPARLTQDTEAGRPEKYVAVDSYVTGGDLSGLDVADVGLQLHVPASAFPGAAYPGSAWSIRGANLCAWEDGLRPALRSGEIVIDPDIGRIVIGVDDSDAADALEEGLLLTYTYGGVGAAGAHPVSRAAAPAEIGAHAVVRKEVNYHVNPDGLTQALDDIHEAPGLVVIEIQDSMTHELDLMAVSGRVAEDGGFNLRLGAPVVIRAADGQRPVIQLRRSLRFRPLDAEAAETLSLRLEGLYLTGSEGFNGPLIARAALNRLEVVGCTLDPGGHRVLDGTAEGHRADIRTALHLREPYGFSDPDEEVAFDQTPEIVVQRSVCGPLLLDRGYRLWISDSIVDAGAGVRDDPADALALSNATDAADGWGPPTHVQGATFLGQARAERLDGRGGIWVHRLQVLDHQRGCIRYSYFSGANDRLPQNVGCVSGTDAVLRFASEVFGEPSYGQLAHVSDFRIRERGPGDNAMGAFGWLQEAHKWRNLQVRFREFMPVGVRPLLVPVT